MSNEQKDASSEAVHVEKGELVSTSTKDENGASSEPDQDWSPEEEKALV